MLLWQRRQRLTLAIVFSLHGGLWLWRVGTCVWCVKLWYGFKFLGFVLVSIVHVCVYCVWCNSQMLQHQTAVWAQIMKLHLLHTMFESLIKKNSIPSSSSLSCLGKKLFLFSIFEAFCFIDAEFISITWKFHIFFWIVIIENICWHL